MQLTYSHVLQQGEKDCGCAAICTLLKSQGFKVNTSKFNSLYYDGFVGINVKRMCEILKDFNINTTLFKVNSFRISMYCLIEK